MNLPARWMCHFATVSMLLAAAFLHAQTAGPSSEAASGVSPMAAPAGDDLATASSATSFATQPRTLASMAGQLAPVVDVLTNVLNQYQKSGNRDGEANTLCALGNSYSSLGQQQKAIEQFQLALAIYRQTGDRKMEANALSRIGDVYHAWGFPDLAVRFYRDALQLQVEIDDKAGKAMVLNNLGVMYLSLSNKKKALDYLNQARAAYHDAGDRHAEVLTLINIGAAENFLAHDAQKAISLLRQAISELGPLNDRLNQADAYELLGAVWAGLHKQETAEMNFHRALQLYHDLGDAHGEASVLRHLKSFSEFHDLASAQ